MQARGTKLEHVWTCLFNRVISASSFCNKLAMDALAKHHRDINLVWIHIIYGQVLVLVTVLQFESDAWVYR